MLYFCNLKLAHSSSGPGRQILSLNIKGSTPLCATTAEFMFCLFFSYKVEIMLVIFDLDGTLLNTLEDLATSGNHILARHGYPTHPTEAHKHLVGFCRMGGIAMSGEDVVN